MDGSTVLVLGAGATLGGGFKVDINGTKFEPPLDCNFFGTPAVISILNDHYPALAHYRQNTLDQSLEKTWSGVDAYHKLCCARIITEEASAYEISDRMQRRAEEDSDSSYRLKMEQEDRSWRVPSMAGWELRELIGSTFEKLGHSSPQQSPLHTLVAALLSEALIGIITFNYDTSVEVLFGDRFYYPLLEAQNTLGKLPLCKLHGSLTWQTDSRAQKIAVANGTAPNNMAVLEHGIGWYRQPEIIGPTLFKQEITFDVQTDFRTKHYRPLWANAWDMLRNARNLIFVGLSFTQTDFHAQALFRSAHLNHRNDAGFHRVLLCHDGDQGLRERAAHLFAGEPVVVAEFDQGLASMVERLDEVMALLHQ